MTSARNPQHSPKKIDESVVTPINADKFAEYLQDYDPALSNFLIEGFKSGFRIPYQGPHVFRLSKNLASLQGNEGVLWQKLNNEIELGRVAGPFSSPPPIS